MEWTRDNFEWCVELCYGDHVIFELEDGRRLKYTVMSSYLTSYEQEFNEKEIFDVLHVHPWEFCKEVVNYDPCSDHDIDMWPEIYDDDFEGLTEIVREIYSRLSHFEPAKILKLNTIKIYDIWSN